MIAGQTNLLADCSSCFGLCCVALPFSKSSDFATNKNAGDPCKNLQEDFGCGIHTGLRKKGFTGCTVYDCFGAGQKVSQQTYDASAGVMPRRPRRTCSKPSLSYASCTNSSGISPKPAR